jgi:hypothetical protein
MTVSQKQLEANRLNAKLGGPKTQEGKDIAKYNALKHGLLAKTAVITDGPAAEDPQEFDNLFKALQEQFLPQGPLEHILVEKIAVAYWRLRRACRQEAELFTPDPDDLLKHFKPKFLKQQPVISSDRLDRLIRYEGAIERQFYRAMHQLERLQRLRAGQIIPPPLAIDIDLNAG